MVVTQAAATRRASRPGERSARRCLSARGTLSSSLASSSHPTCSSVDTLANQIVAGVWPIVHYDLVNYIGAELVLIHYVVPMVAVMSHYATYLEY